jgi:hypothetical protein
LDRDNFNFVLANRNSGRQVTSLRASSARNVGNGKTIFNG